MRGDQGNRWAARFVLTGMGVVWVALYVGISADLVEGLDAKFRADVAARDSSRFGGEDVVVIDRLEKPLFEALGGNYYLSGLYGDDLSRREGEYRRKYGGDPASDRIANANLEWIKGRTDEAVRQWNRVIERFGESAEASADARSRIAYTADQKAKRKIAIEERLKTLGTPKPDSLTFPQKRFLESENPKRYTTCRELSDLYVEEGDLESARKYTLLGHTTYGPTGLCGTCQQETPSDNRWRLLELDAAIKKKMRVVLTPDLRMKARYSEIRVPGLFAGKEIIEEGQTIGEGVQFGDPPFRQTLE